MKTRQLTSSLLLLLTLSVLVLATPAAVEARNCTLDSDCSSLAHRCAPDGHCFIPSELLMPCDEDIQCTYMEPMSECLEYVNICQCINGYHRIGITCVLDPTTTLPPSDLPRID